MDVIYSRKRVKIPRFNKKKIKLIKKFTKVILVIIIITFVSKFIIKSIEPVFENICKAQAKSIATKISNEKATEVMKKYTYNDLVKITRNKENKINGIEFNMITINDIISDIALKIQDGFNEYETEKIGIALGTFSGSKYLSGKGPKINYKIISKGNVETDYRSEFKAVGINQTYHKIYLNVHCKVTILTPFITIEENIENQVILAENIIIGEIPQTYYNFNGIESPTDTLEAIN